MIDKKSLLVLFGCLVLATPVLAGDAAAGKKKAEACADCHGDSGKGDADTPGIAGMKQDEFIKAMGEYRDEKRTKNKKMIKAAKKTTAEDDADLAAYYATLPK